MKNKKGLSLIEVVVALSILGITMVGVLTLAINVIGYSINAKSQTQAIALAQEGLEKARANGGCGYTSGQTIENTTNVNGFQGFTRVVAVEASNLSGLTDNLSYWLISSTVTYTVRGAPTGIPITVKGLVAK